MRLPHRPSNCWRRKLLSCHRVQALSGRKKIRDGKSKEGRGKCEEAVGAYVKYLESLGGQTPATTKEQFLAELIAMGQAAIETRDWQEGSDGVPPGGGDVP